MAILTPRDVYQGNPPSPNHQPIPSLIVDLLDSMMAQMAGGIKAYEDTKADLDLVTAVLGDIGFVLADGTASLNGVYLSDGTTWTKTADLPDGFAALSSGSIDNAKLADMVKKTFMGRQATTTGAPEYLTMAQAKTILGTVARGDFIDDAAFLAGTSDGEHGYSAGVLKWNDNGVGRFLSIDAITEAFRRPALVLTNVAGDGTAYTADSPYGGTWADDPGQIVVFTPHVGNTAGTPTLSVNGGPAFNCGESGSDALGAGRLLAGYEVFLRQVGGAWRLMTDKWITAQISAEIANRTTGVAESLDSTVQAARWRAIQGAASNRSLSEGGRADDPIFVLSATDGDMYWIATNGDVGREIVVSNDQFIDVRHMRLGAANAITIKTYPGSSATIVTDSGNDLIGASAYVKIYRDVLGAYHYDALDGTATLAGGAATPVCDHTIITGGQSLAVRFIDGAGLHGLQLGWKNYAGVSNAKFWAVNGATGGSGLVPASNAVDYWWDPVGDVPGPSATAWKAALDAIPAAQPDPDAILWIFGQTDAGYIGGGDPTMTLAAYKTTLFKVFDWMQNQISVVTNTPIIICPVGAWDQPFDSGAQAVRWDEMELIAENASFHLGPSYFDLPRGWDGVHHTLEGQRLLGYRMAAVLDNVLNAAANDTGPEITGIAESGGGTTYQLTIAPHGADDFTRPLIVDGIGIYQSGADPAAHDWLNITDYTWADIGGGLWTLTLELDLAWPGATIVFPHGACTWARAGRWPMNLRNDPLELGYGNVWPLKPIKSGAF